MTDEDLDLLREFWDLFKIEDCWSLVCDMHGCSVCPRFLDAFEEFKNERKGKI